ncbi:MAG: sulfur oxidation c-type cytochrome SoxA [Gammaproteobacteria bacterium]|nr:sulfur oxidation c-type cytochrome SoxA [Gammaproteobacteria bacterium]
MKKLLITLSALTAMVIAPLQASASPQDDLDSFRSYFNQHFPGVALQDYGNGIYAIDHVRRFEWQESEEFPPYEEALEIGKNLFEKYNIGSCFKKGGKGIKQNYPYFDQKSGKVRTLEQDLMACLKRNGVDTKAEKLGYKKGKLAAISAYMASTSNGKKQNVVVPEDDERAMAAYEDGKTFFYAKRGQLNFSCADCHIYNAGKMARGNLLSPALGQTSHFPVWRKKWAGNSSDPLKGLGTIQRRYGGCNKQVRAKSLKAQASSYNNLEYFHTYMSNGIELNGPAVRQ